MRNGWVTVGDALTTSNFNPKVCRSPLQRCCVVAAAVVVVVVVVVWCMTDACVFIVVIAVFVVVVVYHQHAYVLVLESKHPVL